METQDHPPRNSLRGWVAVVFGFWNPLFAMLYVGRPLRGVVYLALMLLWPVAAFLLARTGLWPARLPMLPVEYAIVLVGMIDAYRIATNPAKDFSPRWLTDWKVLTIAVVVLLALVTSFRMYYFEPFRSPSASMLPTLHEGDEFFVSKRAFRDRPPRRGDVIVFRLPRGDVSYVKRVVGLPGEVVVYDSGNKRVLINGMPLDLEPLGEFADDSEFDVFRETLDARSHSLVLIRRTRGAGGPQQYRVPAGSYFVLGDNRDNSQDSRFDAVGFVPASKIVGRVTWIWWNGLEPKRAGIFPE